MNVYLLDATCKRCGKSGVPLYVVCYDNEKGMRQHSHVQCNQCVQAAIKRESTTQGCEEKGCEEKSRVAGQWMSATPSKES